MRYKKLLFILSIAMFSLTACSKEEKQATTDTEVEESLIDTVAETDMTPSTNADRGEAVGQEVTNEEVIPSEGNNGEGAVDSLSSTDEFTETDAGLAPSNITVNEDGSYSFTDDFLIAVQGINGAAALTDERLDAALQSAADAIVNIGLTSEEDIVSTIAGEISIQEYNQREEHDKGTSNQTQTQTPAPEAQAPVDDSKSADSDYQPATPSQEQVIGGPGFSDFSGVGHWEGDGTHVGTSH